ncbi:MAG: hypothetical protein U0572_02870 [Phycisphaerales bacterium]
MRTSLFVLAAASIAIATLGAGCAGNGQRSESKATPAMVAAFDRLKTLEGEWDIADDGGKRAIGTVFHVTSAGTAIRETMFPGSEHEMTNMFHLDGDSIIATHYCAAGNQPRMRCIAVGDGSRYEFLFADITNLPTPDTEHMAQLNLTITDPDHIVETWESFRAGKVTEHAVMKFTRRK